MGSFSGQILYSLFPAKCPCCGEFCPSTGLCSACILLNLPRTEPRCRLCDSADVGTQVVAKCQKCLTNRRYFDRVWGVFDYSSPVGEAVKNGKSEGRPEHLRTVARIVAEHMPEALKLDPPDVVIPVPLHWRRRLKRGFSAPSSIAHHIARKLKRPVWQGAITRIIDTPKQTGLDEPARRRNVKGAFRARAIGGLDILVVDDVFTTGSTMNEIAKVLKQGDALRVRGLCAAYVEREDARAKEPPVGWTSSANTVVA